MYLEVGGLFPVPSPLPLLSARVNFELLPGQKMDLCALICAFLPCGVSTQRSRQPTLAVSGVCGSSRGSQPLPATLSAHGKQTVSAIYGPMGDVNCAASSGVLGWVM